MNTVTALNTSVPVLLLGGKENSLSVTRHLGKLGIPVRVSGPKNCWGLYSRHCTEAIHIPEGLRAPDFWTKLLLGNDGRLNGHILWALSDDAIEFVNANRDRLKPRYKLDDSNPDLQRAFLDKIRTLELAAAAGVDGPKYWRVETEEQLAGMMAQATFPVMVKGIESHKFTRVFKRKLFIIDESRDELASRIRDCWDLGVGVFVVEMIPGPDSLLSSYYTFRKADGGRLFDFTKSVIRRWPVNRGNACYHRTGWYPETAEAGIRFFDSAGLRGLGNIEFKRDPRDGKLKIIEVNARFTAAQELVRRAGVPIDLVIYCHLTNQPIPEAKQSAKEFRLWYPLRDFLAYLELRKRGELSFFAWLKSVATTRHVSPLFSLSDPLPVLGAALALVHRVFT